MLLFSKPKNQRVKRALDKRAPKIHENPKSSMFIRGGNTSETITQVLKDLVSCPHTSSLYNDHFF